tara:strand:+ start:1224 stop:1538 length:315 start_codon:yes stop_codon:yes gene_type:complete
MFAATASSAPQKAVTTATKIQPTPVPTALWPVVAMGWCKQASVAMMVTWPMTTNAFQPVCRLAVAMVRSGQERRIAMMAIESTPMPVPTVASPPDAATACCAGI